MGPPSYGNYPVFVSLQVKRFRVVTSVALPEDFFHLNYVGDCFLGGSRVVLQLTAALALP